MINLLIIIFAVYLYRRYKKANPTLTQDQKEELRKEQEAQIEKERQERNKREAELKKARQAMLDIIEQSNYRVYFSHSLANEDSEIHPIDCSTNDVIVEGKTNLKELYDQGFRLTKAEKTGSSAQLDAFNFLLHVERDGQKTAKSKIIKKAPPPPPLPPPPMKKS